MDFIHFFLYLFIGVNIDGDPIHLQAHVSVFFIYLSFLLMLIYFHVFVFTYYMIDKKDRLSFFLKNEGVIDFLINFSVALGVMGTLVSIGVAFASSGENITDTISKYFGPALLTTVSGIFLYGYFYVWQAILLYRLKSQGSDNA